VELSAPAAFSGTLAGVAAASARIGVIANQAGQATSFLDVLTRAQATVDSDSSSSSSSSAPLAQHGRAGVATLTALRADRTVTLGQALSLWSGAASASQTAAGAAGASSVRGSFSYPASPDATWAEGLPPAGRGIAGAIDAAARAEGVDPRLLASLVWAESAFKQGSVSHAGATGLTQLMPATAAGLGVDASDPLENLRGGARYLKIQLDRFGSAELALAAYNAGPGRVRHAGGIPDIPETQGYVSTVLGHYRKLGGMA
jgi:soluble lytic murein transglycosylase-like protein